MKGTEPTNITTRSFKTACLALGLILALAPHTERLWAQPPLTVEQFNAILAQTPLDPSTLPFATSVSANLSGRRGLLDFSNAGR